MYIKHAHLITVNFLTGAFWTMLDALNYLVLSVNNGEPEKGRSAKCFNHLKLQFGANVLLRVIHLLLELVTAAFPITKGFPSKRNQFQFSLKSAGCRFLGGPVEKASVFLSRLMSSF